MPTYYQEIIGPKKGYFLNDPFLNLFKPMDWSLPIFITLYLAVAQTLISSFRKPHVVMAGLATYCAISLIRMLSMYVFTLEPPIGMILLVDPITASLVYPESSFAKDLFFSGHVSTMMVLVLVEENKIARVFKIAGTSLVGFLLAWQQVHYTIDLIVAPLVSYGVFIGIQRLLLINGMKGVPTKSA